ncbi:MAG: hypothetical protein HYY09_03445 [Firmicutes bacterium]|nr:hypothetical protein [Bacillota bacterium]
MAVEMGRARGGIAASNPLAGERRARLAVVVGLLVVWAVGLYTAFQMSRIRAFDMVADVGGGYTSSAYTLLTRSPVIWILLAAPFLGMFFASRRKSGEESRIVNGRVMMHPVTGTYLERWVMGLGVLTMLVTAILLGSPTYIHRVLVSPEAIGQGFNSHVVGVVILTFGLFYHLTNRVLSGDFKDFLPSGQDFGQAWIGFKANLGMADPPAAGKHTPSQKVSYLLWLILWIGMIVTGAIKVSTYIVPLPPSIMGPVNVLYAFVLFLGVVLAAVQLVYTLVLPATWPRIRAALTGYISEPYAAEFHSQWYERVKERA